MSYKFDSPVWASIWKLFIQNFSPTPVEINNDYHMSHQVVENDTRDQEKVEIDIDSKTVFDTIDLNFEISPKNRNSDDDFESFGDF